MTDPTFVRLVRHGEVAQAHRGTFYGGAEVPLSEQGRADSLLLAARLADDPVDRVLSSPLSRARAVAEPLAAALGLELQLRDGLRELDRGQWTHLPHAEVERRWPGAIARYLEDPEAGAAPGGETESTFCQRVWQTLDAELGAHPGARLAAVAHGHVIRAILRRVEGHTGPHSLAGFVPYHAVVDLELRADGSGRVLSRPDPVIPEALRSARAGPSPHRP